MNQNDIITEVLVRSGKSTESGWVSDTFLRNWTSQAHIRAAGYHKWPFTEGRTSTTYTTATEDWDFEGYKADSFRYLEVGGKRLQKLNFADYKIAKEASASSADRMFTDFGDLVLINVNADVSGTLIAYGQYTPAIFDNTDLTEETLFSEGNDEGNEAIIQEMLSYVARRDARMQDAVSIHNFAMQLLDELWKRILNEQYQYQTHPDRGGQYKRFDVLKGSVSDEIIKRNQF